MLIPFVALEPVS